MKERRWVRTEMQWACHELMIDITPAGSPRIFTGIHSIKAVAMPNRQGQVRLYIPNPKATERQTILTRLMASMEVLGEASARRENGGVRVSVKDGEKDPGPGMHLKGTYVIEFTLKDGKPFCDNVIKLVREIFARLGVKDERLHHIADFSVTQETFFRVECVYISFASWLRTMNGLPNISATDLETVRPKAD